jgi:hypothetical protein
VPSERRWPVGVDTSGAPAGRKNRLRKPSATCRRCAPVVRLDSLQSARRRGKRLVAVVGKPGRSLCQDLALQLDLSQFAAQLDQFLALVGTERTGWRGNAAGFIALAHPIHDAGGVTAKLLGQLAGSAPRSNQFNHPLTKLRRIGRIGGVRFGHFGLLL